jgi:hypothetical protein
VASSFVAILGAFSRTFEGTTMPLMRNVIHPEYDVRVQWLLGSMILVELRNFVDNSIIIRKFLPEQKPQKRHCLDEDGKKNHFLVSCSANSSWINVR